MNLIYINNDIYKNVYTNINILILMVLMQIGYR